MNPDEARDFLEENGYCLIHLIAMKAVGRKSVCEECAAERKTELEHRLRQAVNVLRGVAPPPEIPTAEMSEWLSCTAKLPKPNQRVEVVTFAMLESDRPGGKERWTINGKPIYWRPTKVVREAT